MTEPIGYGLTHVFAVQNTWIDDTWHTGDRIGEIESLSVLPEHRGSGLGSRLLEQLESHLHERGVDDLILGALAGNADAIRLYRTARLSADVALHVQVCGARTQKPVAAVKKRCDNEIHEVGDVSAVPRLGNRSGEQ